MLFVPNASIAQYLVIFVFLFSCCCASTLGNGTRFQNIISTRESELGRLQNKPQLTRHRRTDSTKGVTYATSSSRLRVIKRPPLESTKRQHPAKKTYDPDPLRSTLVPQMAPKELIMDNLDLLLTLLTRERRRRSTTRRPTVAQTGPNNNLNTTDCYEGMGASYRGHVSRTIRGSMCQSWTASRTVNRLTYPNTGLGDHNFCRNPDGDRRPWCWVNAGAGRFGYCALQQCNGTNRPTKNDSATSVPPPTVVVRLRGGSVNSEGRVEVWKRDGWKSICDDGWGLADANVVCRQLGFPEAIRASVRSEFGAGGGTIGLDEVQCIGYESNILDCRHEEQHDCRLHETAGVVCKSSRVCLEDKEMSCSGSCIPLSYVCDGDKDCTDGADEANCEHLRVTLVGGKRISEGRVEITINNITGTICDDEWDDNDAAVICRMVGFDDGVALAYGNGYFGRGHGPIWLDNVNCQGSEEDIQDCSPAMWGEHNCAHSEDAGVMCIDHNSSLYVAPTTISVPSHHECGRRPIRQPQARIIGGQVAAYGAFPWQARLMKRGRLGEYVHHCGGTVIGRRWILSAAHCFDSATRDDILVRVGDHQSSRIDAHEKEFRVEEIFVHPNYSNGINNRYRYSSFHSTFMGTYYDYDMALIKLKSTSTQPHIEFNDFIQPACLPSNTNHETGKQCEVSGWGLVSHSAISEIQESLKYAFVPLISDNVCKNSYRHSLSKKMFCAGFTKGGADTCQGDSGGPLVCPMSNGSYTVLGITSWGHGCGSQNAPGIYTRVGEMTDWITATMRR